MATEMVVRSEREDAKRNKNRMETEKGMIKKERVY